MCVSRFSAHGQLVHEQVFEGEVLGFRDDVMTWDLKPSGAPPYLPVYMYSGSLGKTNLGNLRNMGSSESSLSDLIAWQDD